MANGPLGVTSKRNEMPVAVNVTYILPCGMIGGEDDSAAPMSALFDPSPTSLLRPVEKESLENPLSCSSKTSIVLSNPFLKNGRRLVEESENFSLHHEIPFGFHEQLIFYHHSG